MDLKLMILVDFNKHFNFNQMVWVRICILVIISTTSNKSKDFMNGKDLKLKIFEINKGEPRKQLASVNQGNYKFVTMAAALLKDP